MVGRDLPDEARRQSGRELIARRELYVLLGEGERERGCGKGARDVVQGADVLKGNLGILVVVVVVTIGRSQLEVLERIADDRRIGVEGLDVTTKTALWKALLGKRSINRKRDEPLVLEPPPIRCRTPADTDGRISPGA